MFTLDIVGSDLEQLMKYIEVETRKLQENMFVEKHISALNSEYSISF